MLILIFRHRANACKPPACLPLWLHCGHAKQRSRFSHNRCMAVSVLHILLLVDIENNDQDVSRTDSSCRRGIAHRQSFDWRHRPPENCWSGHESPSGETVQMLLTAAAKADNSVISFMSISTILLSSTRRSSNERGQCNDHDDARATRYGNRKADGAGWKGLIKDVGDPGNHIAMGTNTNHLII